MKTANINSISSSDLDHCNFTSFSMGMGCYRIIFFIFLCLLFTIDAAVMNVKTVCLNPFGNDTTKSVYRQNLNLLLSNISSQSSVVQFRNLTYGESPDKVYGLFQCRQDLSLEVCTECIKAATQIISQECALFVEAVTWYIECTLRYANRSFFSVNELNPSLGTKALFNASVQYSQVLYGSLDSVISEATIDRKFGHFAISETTVSVHQKLYCLAQCTVDLDAFDCNSCLQAALAFINTICVNGCIRVLSFFTSCQLRFDDNPFYNETYKMLLAPPPIHKEKKLKTPIIAGIAVGSSVGLLVFVGGIYLCMRGVLANKPKGMNEDGLGEPEVVQYDFETLETATEGFKIENKLGQGGFGAVYKGTFKSGEKIAIKRLSKDSGQGANEFMAEARIIAKLQHKYLVKLVGFCSEANEKLLVYEFMPNKSLDIFIFDPIQRPPLGWETRHKIIMGTARGLQYLHEESRITIIHRDMKASNILLDEDMNPKIADFGLAKLFEEKQGKGNTRQIIGTRGYMAPEYTLRGEYSKKTDVYSFGIIVLEIVCGRKNRAPFFQMPEKEDLPTYAWALWNAGQSLEMMDKALENKCSSSEVMRCIQIGMLCVQGDAKERPTMTDVVLMLTGSIELPLPLSNTLPSDNSGMWMPHTSTEASDSVQHSHASYTDLDLYPR